MAGKTIGKFLASGRGLRIRATVVSASIFLTGCSEIQRPKVEPFYAETQPPPKQELRWSNGKMAKNLDPARAAAAPETDIIRAVYEGLTDLDSKTLGEIPGVAESWKSSSDMRAWTFHLRKDARWSNGGRVTARDFVRSWKRLADLGAKAANTHLYQNIVGMRSRDAPEPVAEPTDLFDPIQSETGANDAAGDEGSLREEPTPVQPTVTSGEPRNPKSSAATKFGVEALDESTLQISLDLPDKDFPKLVANPIFRPVYGDGSYLLKDSINAATVTNGAFGIAAITGDAITLERSETYWNRKSIALERVRFEAANTAESALGAYKRGEIDVVTNAAFEPLGLKLLTPYEDFRRTAHSALNFYEFNTANAPFNDRRVREALAIAIDRERLAGGDLEGITEPAYKLFSAGDLDDEALAFNAEKAKGLLENAGYAGGAGFPAIRLIINRNDTQLRVARFVARMWKQHLNIETVVVAKEQAEVEEIRKSRDFDLVRRGVVLPANDEIVNLSSVLGTVTKAVGESATPSIEGDSETELPEDTSFDPTAGTIEEVPSIDTLDQSIMSESDAIYELRIIPLYFPASYALVKPYVRGFEINGLDAPSLKEVSIDSGWQPR